MTRTLIVLRPPFETPTRLALSSNAGFNRLGYGTDDFMWYAPEEATGGSLLTNLNVAGTFDLDRDVAESFDLTLTGFTAFTLSGAITDKRTDWWSLLRQPGSGGPITVAWPSNITWLGDGAIPTLQTAANAADLVGIFTVEDGTQYFGAHFGGGGASTLDGLTDVVISSASNSQILRFNGTSWVNATLVLDDLGDVTVTSVPSNLSNLYYDQAGSTWRDSMRIWRPVMASSSNLLIDGATNEVIMGYA